MLQRMVNLRNARPAIVAAALVVLVQAAGAGAFDALAFRRDAVLHGELWRLATGPWVHLSWAHAMLNLGGLALVLLMFERVVRARTQLVWLAIIGVFTCVGLLAVAPGVQWMVGLSGPLHGLFAANALALTARRDAQPGAAWWRGPRYGWVLLAGLALKLALEHLWHAPKQPGPPGWLGGPVLTEAHVAGAAAGVIVYALWRAISMHRAVATQTERTKGE